MTGYLGKMEVHVHALLPCYLLLMMGLGAGHAAVNALVCLLLHETGHIAVAALLREPVLSLTLMPMGGKVHIGGLYRLPALKLIAIALAGPMASMLGAFIGIMLPHVFPLRFALMNLMLAAFNLLPAAPLDGGRLLTALIRGRLGLRRSVRITVWMGRIFGGMLLAAAVILLFAGAPFLPICIVGIYMIAAAEQESESCEMSALNDVMQLTKASRLMRPMPMQIYTCLPGTPEAQILRILRPDRCTILNWQGTGKWESDICWLENKLGNPP